MTTGITMHVNVKKFLHSRVTTREDGDVLRNYIMMHWEEVDCFDLDFDKLQVASVSFLDEALGMLAEAYPKKEIEKRIRLTNMDENDRQMLDSILKSRITQFKRGRKILDVNRSPAD